MATPASTNASESGLLHIEYIPHPSSTRKKTNMMSLLNEDNIWDNNVFASMFKRFVSAINASGEGFAQTLFPDVRFKNAKISKTGSYLALARLPNVTIVILDILAARELKAKVNNIPRNAEPYIHFALLSSTDEVDTRTIQDNASCVKSISNIVLINYIVQFMEMVDMAIGLEGGARDGDGVQLSPRAHGIVKAFLEAWKDFQDSDVDERDDDSVSIIKNQISCTLHKHLDFFKNFEHYITFLLFNIQEDITITNNKATFTPPGTSKVNVVSPIEVLILGLAKVLSNNVPSQLLKPSVLEATHKYGAVLPTMVKNVQNNKSTNKKGSTRKATVLDAADSESELSDRDVESGGSDSEAEEATFKTPVSENKSKGTKRTRSAPAPAPAPSVAVSSVSPSGRKKRYQEKRTEDQRDDGNDVMEVARRYVRALFEPMYNLY